jgi:SAM-dependent methyltransferase
MGMTTVEIPDGEIKVEELMKMIRENISQHKHISNDTRKIILAESPEIQKDLAYINSNWDIQNAGYSISSHRPVVGKVLIKGRGLVHGEVKRYVDPTILKQRDFNGSVVRILNDVERRMNLLNGIMKSDLDERIGQLKSDISAEIEEQLNLLFAAMDKNIRNKAWLAEILETKASMANDYPRKSSNEYDLGLNPFLFEEKLRNNCADAEQKKTILLQYFVGCKNVLDIGCGRGDFLERMTSEGIDAIGIDLDEDFVRYCKAKGFNVHRQDPINYLEALDDKSLDGVFLNHLVEHLKPDYLLKLLNLCYRKMIYGHYIIVAATNPLSFASLANFYIDPRHKKPVHPETLKFLLIANGFRDIETKFYAPLGDEMRLEKMRIEEHLDDKERQRIEIYNRNIDMLNSTLYGSKDYMVIGAK